MAAAPNQSATWERAGYARKPWEGVLKSAALPFSNRFAVFLLLLSSAIAYSF